MTQIPSETHAEARLSGRELARQRRKAMASVGKRAVKPAGRQVGAASASASSAPSSRKASRAAGRHEQAGQRQQAGCGCGCKGGDSQGKPAQAAVRPRQAGTHARGRDIAQARRKALSSGGKAGMQPAAQATRKGTGNLSGTDARVARNQGMSGRQIAMQRRKTQSLTGRGDAPSASSGSRRPTGQRDARTSSAPPKVEAGRQLAGHGITGTKVDRASQVTGNEAGSTRAITGTAYLSAGESRDAGTTRPQAPGGTGGVAPTPSGKPLTGTRVSSHGRVTGGEAGAGRHITGTRYARADASRTAPSKVAVSQTANGSQVTGTTNGHSARISGTETRDSRATGGSGHPGAALQAEARKPAAPRKVSVMSAPDTQAVTGTSVGRDRKVTGNETGSSRAISGTPYFNNQDFGDAGTVEAPAKVGAAFTRAGTRVSGTEVSANPKMTGDEEGRCSLVTGTDYVGARDMQASCAAGTPADHAVSKVAVDQTWQGEVVTGSGIGRSVKMTGDESGSCAAVSGTPYIGQSQYTQFCEAPEADQQLARVPTRGIVSAADITGDRPGAGGSVMTGDERGACEPVTGTPYVGADNMPSTCAADSAGSGRFVARRQQDAQAPRAPAPGDFSIASPARQAFDQRQGSAVTGALMSNAHITGSASRAEGLITGTPEFRHRDGDAPASRAALAQADERQRLTGEASQRSATITGDAWGAQQRVTGTEGPFSANRNPTMRGQPRGAGRSAMGYRDLERPDVPESPVTGSAGAAKRGAMVTVSGGARG